MYVGLCSFRLHLLQSQSNSLKSQLHYEHLTKTQQPDAGKQRFGEIIVFVHVQKNKHSEEWNQSCSFIVAAD